MSDPIYDLPDPDGTKRPVYSLDDASEAEAAGGWSPAPVGSRRWLREQDEADDFDDDAPSGTGRATPTWEIPSSIADLDDIDPTRAPESPHVFDLPSPRQSAPPAWPASSFPAAESWSAPAPAAEPVAPAQQPAASFPPPEVPQASWAAPTPVDQAPDPSSFVAPQGASHVAAAEVPAAPVAPPTAASSIALSQHALTQADHDLIEALCQVVLQGGSDLHITVDAPPSIRIDGHLQPVLSTLPWDREKVRRALSSLLSADRQREFQTQLELDFAYSLSEDSRFRVNFYQQRGVLGAVFRLIPTEIKTLEQLGMDPAVSKFAGLPRGLVLVTGPTGSGKSTTLAALIDLVNRTRADHIVTVEDPIEFIHQHKRALVNQREVGSDTHSFANALKHVLRQDPDVILIGELRDLETISVALTAAETGHLVFATLHTQDAAQTIDRVIDVFPPHQQDQVRTQLASTLQGVVCQTLVPRATGRGRIVATEIMMMTPAVGNLIREGKTYQISSSMQAGRDLGMHTMDQDLAELVNTGKVTLKAAMDKVHDTEGFHRLVTRTDTGASQGLAAGGIDFGDAFSGSDH
ncbi:Twitching mobility protein [Frondihabitans sp. 762G35]|uniref:type IV pilus twitching motility protein PilT n=1 Tax=Frondihabitans sp. 762G35 TaxID=1446794 RepID=UPI000D20CFD8|nr:PilT/PilU family type 4a pilus ATPase [Frondihabitans sp. 762G35]ARC55729.1 Twitching mobility protein [Frondihabitans sp. 762G35]